MSTAVAVIGLAFSVSESRKAEKQREKAVEVQEKTSALQNAKARRQQVAQSRRLRAAAIAQGEAQGVSGGSQVAGAVGSVQTQTATNISFLNQLEGFDRARFGALSSAQSFEASAGIARSIAGVAASPTGKEVESQVSSFLKK